MSTIEKKENSTYAEAWMEGKKEKIYYTEIEYKSRVTSVCRTWHDDGSCYYIGYSEDCSDKKKVLKEIKHTGGRGSNAYHNAASTAWSYAFYYMSNGIDVYVEEYYGDLSFEAIIYEI